MAAAVASRADHLVSAADLIRRCKDPEGQLECGTYIAGVMDGYLAGTFVDAGNSDLPLICLPPDTRQPHLINAFIALMETNPSLLNPGGGVVVFMALRRSFPSN
jgi:hypothetical protein